MQRITLTPDHETPAVKNINQCPARAFVLIRGNLPGHRIGLVKAGESGYHATDADTLSRHATNDELNELVDGLNADIGVTRAQRHAMEIGSMFGWELPGANPEHPLNLQFGQLTAGCQA